MRFYLKKIKKITVYPDKFDTELIFALLVFLSKEKG